MQLRTGWLAVLAITSFVGCTEWVGPPASPAYWKPRPPDPNPPQSLLPGDPEPDEEESSPARELVAATIPQPVERPRSRSINLGYTGDGVLTGGITRDTPVQPRQPPGPYANQSWQDYVNAPRWRVSGPQWRGRVGPMPYYGYGAPHGMYGSPMGAVPPCSYGPNGAGPAW